MSSRRSKDRLVSKKSQANSGWDSQTDSNTFLNSAASASLAASSASRSNISKIFDNYRDDVKSDPDQISVQGTMNYFQAVGANLDDVASLVVSEIVQCPTMGEITREGFVKGWSELGGDTLEKQKAIVRARRATLASPVPRDREVLKKIYKHAFKLGITVVGQRSVDKDTCIEFWKMLFSEPSLAWRTQSTDWLSLFLKFVGENGVKGINADVWNQTFAFAEASIRDESLSWWSEEAAWPALVDEFVKWMREKRGKTQDEDMEDMDC